MKFLFVILLFLTLFSCKDDPTVVEITVIDANLLPVDSAMVIFTADPYNGTYTNEIILNDTFYTDTDGFLQVDYSDRQTNGQTGFTTALIKVSKFPDTTEVNLNIPQFETTRKKIVLQ